MTRRFLFAGIRTLSATLLEAEGISRQAVDGTWLLHDVRLTLAAGERVAIVGPTGAGKTLLLRSLALLDPLQAGQVLWQGASVESAAVPRFRSQATYLHQRPALFEGTVESNLRMPFALRVNRDKTYEPNRLAGYLQLLGCSSSFLGRSTRDLSGGERQIVAALRAIQLHPLMLLLDEPTAALDPASALIIESLVARWHAEHGAMRSVIWVSHNAEQAARVADRVLQLQAGRIQGAG